MPTRACLEIVCKNHPCRCSDIFSYIFHVVIVWFQEARQRMERTIEEKHGASSREKRPSATRKPQKPASPSKEGSATVSRASAAASSEVTAVSVDGESVLISTPTNENDTDSVKPQSNPSQSSKSQSNRSQSSQSQSNQSQSNNNAGKLRHCLSKALT